MSIRIAGFTHGHQRKDRRLELALRVEIEGKVYKTVDWSLGGFMVEGYEGKLEGGWEVRVESIGLEQGDLVRLGAPAHVVRVDKKKKKLAIAYNGLSSRTYDILEGLTMGKIRRPKS